MSDKTKLKIQAGKRYFISWIRTFKGSITVVCLLLLIVIPFFTSSPYILGIFVTAMIFTIFAASWDFLAGFVGQVSFGHSIFLGVSAYFTAIFIRIFGFPWWLSMIIGFSASVGFSLFIGIICLRLKGPYLALGTLVFSIIIYDVLMMGSLSNIFFGTEGISGLPAISPDPSIIYLFVLIITVISLEILIFTGKSNFGTILKSIRDDETGAIACGINISKYKVYAFMISSLFAGVAGGLFALNLRAVNPAVFGSIYSFYAIIMASLGGLATISGSALGAFFFIFLGEILRPTGDFSILIFAVILIIIVRFAEHGILKPVLERLKDLFDLLVGR